MTVADEACPTDTPGVYRIIGKYVVTGGTDNFAGARGQGIAICFGDFKQQHLQGHLGACN